MKIKLGCKTRDAGRVFCIGMNYAEHVKELKNTPPDSPVIFMKPSSSLIKTGCHVPFPSHGSDLHFEAELVVMIGKGGRPADESEARFFVEALSLGLDLTLRDVQTRLRQSGHPWEISKAFDCSAPVGDFVPFDDSFDLRHITFTCRVNGELRQSGDSADMIFPVERLIYEIGKVWEFKRGDLIYTGTPSGVGSLQKGDTMLLSGKGIGSFSWQIV